MTDGELIELARAAMVVMVKLAAPPLLAGMLVGLIISIMQAMTQIQEHTLTFVPKVLTVFVVLLLFLPFMLHTLEDFTHHVLDLAIAGG
jgi:flagellar biosynthetic protein FliQ